MNYRASQAVRPEGAGGGAVMVGAAYLLNQTHHIPECRMELAGDLSVGAQWVPLRPVSISNAGGQPLRPGQWIYVGEELRMILVVGERVIEVAPLELPHMAGDSVFRPNQHRIGSDWNRLSWK